MTTMAAISPYQTLILCNHLHQLPFFPPSSSLPSSPSYPQYHPLKSRLNSPLIRRQIPVSTNVTRRPLNNSNRNRRQNEEEEEVEREEVKKKIVKAGLWGLEGLYIFWLFLLPYAPGDPVWAISSETISSLVGLSLNFFFILPLANAVGIHVLEAPVLHPMSEGLFNFVIGWTLLFAPLLFTDLKNDRYRGSLDVLWGFQMFLTNTFLIPYMAIRLNEANGGGYRRMPTQLGTVMTQGAPVVGLIGGAVSVLSILWALFGRADGDFGSVSDRWDFLLNYLGSERLAYAFIWDIVLYTIFQPWLIDDNLANVREERVTLVKNLSFIPVIGLVAYLLCLKREEELYMVNRSLDD